jgi:hypothetical protein
MRGNDTGELVRGEEKEADGRWRSGEEQSDGVEGGEGER